MTNELTLREVAKAILNKHAVSGRELNRLAEKKGHRINYTTINSMAAGTYMSRPSKETLDALVALSDFTVEEVYAAAHRPVPLQPLAEVLPDGSDALLPGQREAVLAVVRQFIKDNERQEVGHGAAANTEAPDSGADPKEPKKRQAARPSKSRRLPGTSATTPTSGGRSRGGKARDQP